MSMQLSMRAAALRGALERASGTVATVTATGHRVRLSVPYSLTWTLAQFQLVLRAVQAGDDWGGNSHPEAVMWTELIQPEAIQGSSDGC